jgi:hypothetical protein
VNTAQSTSAVDRIGPATSFMACCVASIGLRPSAMFRSTFSTTTMASSTTMPMARTRPNRVRALRPKPSISRAAKVPIRDTGTAIRGMIEARQLCRNSTTTRTTRRMASIRVWITALIDSCTKIVVS